MTIYYHCSILARAHRLFAFFFSNPGVFKNSDGQVRNSFHFTITHFKLILSWKVVAMYGTAWL